MKYLICVSFLIACTLNSLAEIRTVSNNPGYPAQYATIPAAISAASPGDTIYIYPSGIPYSDAITTSKQLVLIGPGLNPLRPNHLPATIPATISITGATASGFVLMGLQLSGGSLAIGTSSQPVNNVIISECIMGQITYLYCNNIVFENNIVPMSGAGSATLQFWGTSQRIIQNNIIENNIALKFGDAIIRNNVFASNDANRKAFYALDPGYAGPAIQIQNNIFYKNGPDGYGNDGYGGSINFCSPCEYKNNICYLTVNLPPANSNSSGNLNTDPLFVNYPLVGAPFSFNYNYHLQAASPGVNYGIDGKDAGMWGGSSPVNAGFEPPIPRVYQLAVSNANVPAGGTIQLTIKATRAQ